MNPPRMIDRMVARGRSASKALLVLSDIACPGRLSGGGFEPLHFRIGIWAAGFEPLHIEIIQTADLDRQLAPQAVQ
jgi:hypothetical protein